MRSSIGSYYARILAGLLATGVLAFSQSAPVARSTPDRIRDLTEQARVQTDSAARNGLLRERARLLTILMEENPRAAVETALSDEVRQDLLTRYPDSEEFLEQKGEWTGPLETSVADDLAHGHSWTIRMLRLAGHPVRLYWDSPAAAQCAPSATVKGIRLGNRIAASTGQVLTSVVNAASACSTTGEQNTAVLLINFLSTPLTAGYTTDYVKNIFFGPAPSVTDYWRESSYGTTFASGDVFGPFTLSADYTCDQQDEILDAAIQAADSTVDFTAYTRIFLILPVTVAGGCAYDGIAQLGCSLQQSPSKGAFTASATWIESITIMPNVYGALGGLLQTAIHEGGHNFGLRHASSTDYDTLPAGPIGVAGVHSEYGDPFSTMGTNPGHYAAPHKSTLGWLSEGTSYLNVSSAGTWTIAPLSAQTPASTQALRVQRGTGNNQYLWVEYRQPIGSYEPSVLDNAAPRNFNGALIHIEDPTQSAWAGYTELLDFQPVRLPNDFNQSILPAGTTWSDPYSNLTLTTGSATPSGITVTVSYDNGCATLSTASQSFGPFAGTGQIKVTAPNTCSWTAVTDSEWVTFTGAYSGTGSGTVNYAVTTNATPAARSGIISISHQTFNVNQAAQQQGGSVSVTPSSGTGSQQAFAFVFADPSAWTNLTWGEVLINASQVNSHACYIHWDAASNSLSLRDDGDDAWLGPVAIGASTPLQNSQCVLSVSTVTLTGTGASATLNLNVAFTNWFAGSTKNVYMDAQSASSAVGWQQTGTWTVTFPFAPGTVSPNAGSGSTQVFTFTVPGIYTTDQIYTAFSTSTAFGTLEFYNYGCALEYEASTSTIYLFGDVANAGTGTTGTFTTGQPIHNSQCTVNMAGSSAVLSGSTLTLTLPITFASTFTGTENIYVFGPGTGWPTGASYSPIGTFTVTAAPAPAPTVSLTPASLTFSQQALSSSSAAQTVTLSNTGNAALTISSIAFTGTGASSFTKTSSCGSTLSAGAHCTISVTFTPTAVGALPASLAVTDNAAGSPHTVALSGTGVGTPVAGVSPSALTFSSSTVGATSAAQTVTLSNTGNAALTISGIAFTGTGASSFAQTNGCGSTLSAGAHCTISVTFTPTAVGALPASLAVTDNATGSPHTVALSGTGVGTPVAGVSPSALTFSSSTVGATSAAQTVTLSNTGNAALTISSIALTGTGASSFGQTNGCGSTLSAGAHCTISVTFTPTAVGALPASLAVTDNATGSPHTVALSGTGVGTPVAGVSPSALTFSSSKVGATSAAQTVTLSNTGNAALTISGIALTGTGASSFAQTNGCGSTLSAGAHCTISVTFTPTAAGALAASLAVTDNATGTPHTVALSGTGVGTPVAGVSPSALTFSSLAVGGTSAAQTVTLSNTGNAALTISSIALTGAGASSFTKTSACGATLSAGAHCTISVTFHPTAEGSQSASLTVTDNASSSPQSVALTGTGLGPVVSLGPSTVSFASQAVGTTSTAQTVTLSNTGNAALTISNIAISGAGASSFAKTTTCGATLSAGAHCTISLTFHPAAEGSQSASLTVTDNAAASPQSVTLTGTGLGPVASLSSSALTFSTQAVNTTSAAQTVTLTNTGNATLTISNIAITGSGASLFAKSSACGATLSAGSHCTISLTFRPTSTGSHSASLTITDNAAGNSQTVTLTGTGH